MEQEDYRRLLFDLIDAAYTEGDPQPERRAIEEYMAIHGDPDASR